MNKTLRFLLLLSVCTPLTKAQSPVATAIAPVVNASLGYSFIDHAGPTASRIQLNGPDAAFTVDVVPRLGGRLDVGYGRASNVLGSGNHSDVLSYLAGPVFYPARHRKLAVFVQGLFGAARVTGPIPASSGGFSTGYVNQFAWAIGAGAQYRASDSIGFRIGADYLHTRYYDLASTIRGQGNLRMTVSFVYFFVRHSSKRHSSPAS